MHVREKRNIHKQMSNFKPVCSMSKRFQEKFLIKDTWTERYRRSAIPYMQRLLNDKERKKQGILRQISNFVPVNNGSSSTLSLR